MGYGIHKKDSDGFITVFLSLILILIISLVMTIIEGARITTAKIVAERALTTAMDSVLAGYYAPLFEEYHILGLETGDGSNGVKRDEREDNLKEYISYTFQPGQNFSDENSRVEFYDTSVASLQVTNDVGLMDYDGEIYINECVEYMKYKELGNGMELLLDKLSVMEEPKKVSYLYEEKLKVEEELVVIDEGILVLMGLLDGISTDKKGIKTNKDGSLKTTTDFIKKICYGTVTKEKVGIFNDSIYQVLQDHYVDPTNIFTLMNNSIDCLEEAERQLSTLEIEHSQIIVNIDKEQETLGELNQQLSEAKTKEEETEEIEVMIDNCREGLDNLQNNINEIDIMLTEYRQKKLDSINEIQNAISLLHGLLTPIIPLITDAIIAMEGIMEASAKADPLIENYETILKEHGKGLSEDTYGGLEEGLTELKRYQTGNVEGYNFIYMRDILQENSLIISSVEEYLIDAEEALLQEGYQNTRLLLTQAGKALTDYQIEGLCIDYSSLVIRKEGEMEPLESMRSILKEGLVGLVVDPATLSNAEITEELLPSVIYALSDQPETEFNFSSLFEELVIGGNSLGIGSLFQSFGNLDASTLLKDGANQVAEHVLFWRYLEEHFSAYTSKEDELKKRKPSSLIYEQEYLLSGKRSDLDNLSSVISKIILLRTLLNFTSILGDKAKWSESKALAATLVGFTGLPILVSITQTIIMILLAFAEALVDTSALLMGKEVQFIKKKINYSAYELIHLNRMSIQAKAASYPEKDSGFSLSYKGYVSIFLLIKNKKDLSYRSMDLIQENLRMRYENTFSFANCLYGFDAKAKFITKQKFISLAVLQKYINHNNNFEYTIQAGYSY